MPPRGDPLATKAETFTINAPACRQESLGQSHLSGRVQPNEQRLQDAFPASRRCLKKFAPLLWPASSQRAARRNLSLLA